MTGAELLEYTRNDVLRDKARPYLWSDELIYRYMSEAERLFCRSTDALLDNSSAFTTLDLSIGVNTYELDKRITYLYSAALSTSSTDLLNYTRQFLPSNLLTATGTPSAFVMDEAAGLIRVYPTPDQVFTLNLRAARLPLVDIGDTTSPEIPVQYHLDLAEYVAYRCLRNNDVDGRSEMDAELFKKNWGQAVSRAKNDYYRLRAGNNPMARSNWTGKER